MLIFEQFKFYVSLIKLSQIKQILLYRDITQSIANNTFYPKRDDC